MSQPLTRPLPRKAAAGQKLALVDRSVFAAAMRTLGHRIFKAILIISSLFSIQLINRDCQTDS